MADGCFDITGILVAKTIDPAEMAAIDEAIAFHFAPTEHKSDKATGTTTFEISYYGAAWLSEAENLLDEVRQIAPVDSFYLEFTGEADANVRYSLNSDGDLVEDVGEIVFSDGLDAIRAWDAVRTSIPAEVLTDILIKKMGCSKEWATQIIGKE